MMLFCISGLIQSCWKKEWWVNDMGVSKWWPNFHLWVNYPFTKTIISISNQVSVHCNKINALFGLVSEWERERVEEAYCSCWINACVWISISVSCSSDTQTLEQIKVREMRKLFWKWEKVTLNRSHIYILYIHSPKGLLGTPY